MGFKNSPCACRRQEASVLPHRRGGQPNSPRDGRFIEQVGTYNPMLPADHADRMKLVTERLTHWLPTVRRRPIAWRGSWARPA